MKMITIVPQMIRIKHWSKNLFIFLPIFFSGNILNLSKLFPTIVGFISFSLIASSVYIINDLNDIERDRLHPVKCNRPIPSGEISPRLSLIIALSLLLLSTIMSLCSSFYLFLIIISYFIINIFYTFLFKNISIIDVFIIAIGFVLRLEVGSIQSIVSLSAWLIIMVFLLSLFMALGKRRDDIILKNKTNVIYRNSLSGYNLDFLNISISMVCSIMIVCYIMYVLSPDIQSRYNSEKIIYSTIFVILGMFRYLQLIFVYYKSGSPTTVLITDRFIQFVLFLWILFFFILIYII